LFRCHFGLNPSGGLLIVLLDSRGGDSSDEDPYPRESGDTKLVWLKTRAGGDLQNSL
jgi:hypothetical protein